MAGWSLSELLQKLEEQNRRNHGLVLASWRAEYRELLHNRLTSLALHVDEHQRQRCSQVISTVMPPSKISGDASRTTTATTATTTTTTTTKKMTESVARQFSASDKMPWQRCSCSAVAGLSCLLRPSHEVEQEKKLQHDVMPLDQQRLGSGYSHVEGQGSLSLCAGHGTSLLAIPKTCLPDAGLRREDNFCGSNHSLELGVVQTRVVSSPSVRSGSMELWNTDDAAVKVVTPPPRQRLLHGTTHAMKWRDTPPHSPLKEMPSLDGITKESLAAMICRLYDDTPPGPQHTWSPKLRRSQTKPQGPPLLCLSSLRADRRGPHAAPARARATRKAFAGDIRSSSSLMSKEQVTIELRRLYGLADDNST